MWCFVVTATIRQGSEPKVREILREGPPFDFADSLLERHAVFLARDEVNLPLRGPRADRAAMHLIESPRVLGRASGLAAHMCGRPRLPEEVLSWERPKAYEGLSFAPQPEPDDSEGRPGD